MKEIKRVIKNEKNILNDYRKAEKTIEDSLNKYLYTPIKVQMGFSFILVVIKENNIKDKEALKKNFISFYNTYRYNFIIPLPKEIFSKEEIKELRKNQKGNKSE